MTCEVNINGSTVKARALLDSASSASFISERLAQSLSLSRSPLSARISGVAGLIHKSPLQSVATFTVSPTRNLSKKFTVTAVVVPRVTCDLPQHPISFDPSWKHLHQLPMADPHFGVPSRIDILLECRCLRRALSLMGARLDRPDLQLLLKPYSAGFLLGELNLLILTLESPIIVYSHDSFQSIQ